MRGEGTRRGPAARPESATPGRAAGAGHARQSRTAGETRRPHQPGPQPPGFLCYFITDEPSAAAFPALGKLVAYLRERDPAHLAYINLFPTYANNQQLGTKGDKITAYKDHLRQYIEVVRALVAELRPLPIRQAR